MSAASAQWQSIAGPMKKATVIPGDIKLDPDHLKEQTVSGRAGVSLAGPVALEFMPFVNRAPASNTVHPRPGLYGSVAAAQDVCAKDLRCLGVRSQEGGTTALLYPGCSKPKVITDLVAAMGSTTWVAKRP